MNYLYSSPILKVKRRQLRDNQTEAEIRLWGKLRGRQLNGLRFLRQYSVGPFIIDFYCPKLRLGIELDGGQHNDPEQQSYEGQRHKYLDRNCINMIRFWNNEVLNNIEGVLMRLDGFATRYNPT